MAWDWVSTARPEFAAILMSEISRAWEWTIAEQVGLFCPYTLYVLWRAAAAHKWAGMRTLRAWRLARRPSAPSPTPSRTACGLYALPALAYRSY